MSLDRVVIVGASLAGFRAAEELRAEGFDGHLSLIGDEPHLPYDRPPLSKQVLAGKWGVERIALTTDSTPGLDLDWCLGATATGLDLTAREVLIGGGERIGFDGLVIATGATPRRLPGTDHLDGVFTLRSLDDCLTIRAAIEAGARRVVVVGAGFIGAEVAATCRTAGLEVVLVEALQVPLERGLGPRLGAFVADLHRDHGVDVRLGVGVLGVDGGTRVERVRLTDGTVDDVDLVVIGIGVSPNTGWLAGSGLDITDGVLCDEACRVAPGVVAAGDVARWPNVRFGEVMRVEHWDNALDMGCHAAHTLLAGSLGGSPYRPIPWFWSDQYDRKIQLAGRAGPDDEVEIIEGSVEERRFVALFGRRGRLTGALGVNRPAQVARWRAQINTGISWDDALTAARAVEPLG